ncbi:MAG: hypothetical protein KC519_04395, partial [Anaerolineae bacterium]|nr:hypothetical protein [Anaerolineae bacterium]
MLKTNDPAGLGSDQRDVYVSVNCRCRELLTTSSPPPDHSVRLACSNVGFNSSDLAIWCVQLA